MSRRQLSSWLIVAARVILGAVFVAAALPKIADPPGFAKAIWAYQLVPESFLPTLALTLPWLELLCGLALVAGLWTRAAAAWSAILLACFMLFLGINLARRHPVDCGCFSTQIRPKTEAEKLADMRFDLFRDAALLALSVAVLATGGQRVISAEE